MEFEKLMSSNRLHLAQVILTISILRKARKETKVCEDKQTSCAFRQREKLNKAEDTKRNKIKKFGAIQRRCAFFMHADLQLDKTTMFQQDTKFSFFLRKILTFSHQVLVESFPRGIRNRRNMCHSGRRNFCNFEVRKSVFRKSRGNEEKSAPRSFFWTLSEKP